MKVFITALLLITSFSVAARDDGDALFYRGRLVNIFNGSIDLKCNALIESGNEKGAEINEFARKKIIQLAMENEVSVSAETDNFTLFGNYVSLRATYENTDKTHTEYFAKIYLINNNKNLYKMDIRVKNFKVDLKTRATEITDKALVTCINEDI